MTSISDIPDARKVCYWIPNKPGLFLPLLSTHNITESNNNLTHAIIAIHGLSGNIVQAYHSVVDSFTPIFKPTNLLVVVPWFHSTPITSSDWGNCTGEVITPDMGARSIYWARNESSWIAGGVGDNLVTLSAYTLLDHIYTSLSDRNDFPSLQHITFAGFSAGGQMLNRYAWASKVGLRMEQPSTETTTDTSATTTTTTTTTTDSSISVSLDLPRVRFIVSDPSSFLYFSRHRPALSCRARLDTGPAHTCDSFTLYTLIMPYDPPTQEASSTLEQEDRLMAITNCREFDTWKYGTALPSTLHSESYLKQFRENPQLIAEHTQAYRHKDVRYVLGAWDSCNCEGEGYSNPPHCLLPIKTAATIPSIPTTRNDDVYTVKQCTPSIYDNSTDTYALLRGNAVETATTCCDTFPDSTNNDLSITCGSELQGSNRLQRGLNYMSYLQHYFNNGMEGEGAYSSEQNEEFVPMYTIVPELRHDCPAFFATAIVQEWALQLEPLVVPPPDIPQPSKSSDGGGRTAEHSDGQDNTEETLLGSGSTVHIAVLAVVLVLLLHFVYTASRVVMRVSREAQRQRHREASREGGPSETSYLL